MIEIKDKRKCCGCSACANVCPKNAIEMKYDDEGFAYPTINKEKCINCGLCEKICPILNKLPIIENENFPIVYACYNKNNEIRKKSSSRRNILSFSKSNFKKRWYCSRSSI